VGNKRAKPRLFQSNDELLGIAAVHQPGKMESRLPSEAELFHLYEKIAEARPGTRDAEIFEKIHEWSFSDFSRPPHEFAGISKAELIAWQMRHRINLSSGHIRPAHIDLARGHAWGTIRRNDHVNGRHTQYGPPSREELLEMMGAAR
jgi:hypothetical protein